MRPDLSAQIHPDDITAYYWTKNELRQLCKVLSVSGSGSKFDLINRIRLVLQGKELPIIPKAKPQSSFDWNSNALNEHTIITDNFKVTRAVRNFYFAAFGPNFKSTVPWMAWMKQHIGATLGDGVRAWYEEGQIKKVEDTRAYIAPQFEFNRYIQAFMMANPTLKRSDALHCWQIKKQQRGERTYQDSDLDWL